MRIHHHQFFKHTVGGTLCTRVRTTIILVQNNLEKRDKEREDTAVEPKKTQAARNNFTSLSPLRAFVTGDILAIDLDSIRHSSSITKPAARCRWDSSIHPFISHKKLHTAVLNNFHFSTSQQYNIIPTELKTSEDIIVHYTAVLECSNQTKIRGIHLKPTPATWSEEGSTHVVLTNDRRVYYYVFANHVSTWYQVWNAPSFISYDMITCTEKNAPI